MAITLSTAARNAACDAIVDLIDAGTGAGNFVIRTSGDVEVATCAMSATAFGAASSGTATANAITNDTSATGGVAAKFTVEDGDGTTILNGTVGTSGADLIVSNTTIGVGDTFSITSFAVTMPAS